MKSASLVSLLILAGCSQNPNGPVEVTGQIEAVSVVAGSRIGGRVIEVLVEEGDHVRKGDFLLRLEADEAGAAVAAAQAQVAGAQAMLAKLEAGARPEQIRQAEAAAAAAEEQYRLAQKGFRSQEIEAAAAAAGAARAQRDEARAVFSRIERLYQGNAASEERRDQAKHALEAAEEQYRAARERQDLVVEGARTEEINMAKARFDQAAAMLDELRNGARPEDIDAARAATDAANADLMRAQVALDEMTIRAPRDGVIESIDVHPGDLVKPGGIVSIVDPDALELFVYVSAAMLGHLRLGQAVTLTTDSHGGEVFEGAIKYIAPTGEYTPRNLQTKEERAQQVFGVKIALDAAGGRLRAGMTVTAHLTPATGGS